MDLSSLNQFDANYAYHMVSYTFTSVIKGKQEASDKTIISTTVTYDLDVWPSPYVNVKNECVIRS